MAYSAKVRIDQIGSNDTTDTLTNGVSSRRNQLLMDISSELGVASVDGAAEATLDKLAQIVNKAAPNYKPFGAVLSEALRDRLRSLFGAAGVKQQYIRDRVTNVWQLGEGWVASVLATLLLDTREGASSRGRATWPSCPPPPCKNKPEADKLLMRPLRSSPSSRVLPWPCRPPVVPLVALWSIPPRSTPSPRRSPVPTACSAATARFVLNELGVAAPAPEESEDENAAVVAAVKPTWLRLAQARSLRASTPTRPSSSMIGGLPPAKTSPAPTTTTIPPP